MLLKLVGVVLRSGECQSGRDDTLDCGVVRKVEEERDTIETAVRLEVLLEESRGFHVDTHRRKHDGEVVLMTIVHVLRGTLDQASLSYNLCSNLGR